MVAVDGSMAIRRQAVPRTGATVPEPSRKGPTQTLLAGRVSATKGSAENLGRRSRVRGASTAAGDGCAHQACSRSIRGAPCAGPRAETPQASQGETASGVDRTIGDGLAGSACKHMHRGTRQREGPRAGARIGGRASRSGIRRNAQLASTPGEHIGLSAMHTHGPAATRDALEGGAMSLKEIEVPSVATSNTIAARASAADQRGRRPIASSERMRQPAGSACISRLTIDLQDGRCAMSFGIDSVACGTGRIPDKVVCGGSAHESLPPRCAGNRRGNSRTAQRKQCSRGAETPPSRLSRRKQQRRD